MKKTVKNVFLLLGLIVLIFLIWQLFFTDDGILVTAYNAMANGVNNQYEKVAGQGEQLLPTWDETGADTNGQGFDIEAE